MTNLFDAPEGRFNVTVNDETQHSLCTSFLETPAGWRVTSIPDNKQACLAHVEAHWTDMRPPA